MALTVPDYANASFVEQAGLDSVDIDAIVAALDDSVVVAGCLVTQRAAGANLSVDVAAGTVAVQGGLATVAGGNVAVTADATNPRWALISANSSGTVAATLGTAAALPVFPAIPASSVPLAVVWIPAAAGSILNANIVDKRPFKTAPSIVASGSASAEALTYYGRTAAEASVGVDKSPSWFTDGAAGDMIYRLIDNTKLMRWGFGTGAASRMQLSNTALTLPAGQTLTTGTRSVVTGTRATTTNASDTVDLGTFSSTGGAIELRIHAHLAAPASGATASKTKVYEFAVDSTTGLIGNGTFTDAGSGGGGYKVLPSDQDAGQATANDFALEVRRSAAGTFIFRFRQITIGVAGVITFTVESLGDTAVAFTPSTTVTTAPAVVTTAHPSNGLVAAGGNVGIGTDAPGMALDIKGSGNTVVEVLSSSGDAYLQAVAGFRGVVGTAGVTNHFFTGTTPSDMAIGPEAVGSTLHLGMGIAAGAIGSQPAMLRLTTSDAWINDNGTARSVPRGEIGYWEAGAAGTAAGTSETAVYTAVAPTNNASGWQFVSGRRYVIHVRYRFTPSAASTTGHAVMRIRLGSGLLGTSLIFKESPQNTTGILSVEADSKPLLCGTDFAAGTSTLTLIGAAATGTLTSNWASGAFDSNTFIWVEDLGSLNT